MGRGRWIVRFGRKVKMIKEVFVIVDATSLSTCSSRGIHARILDNVIFNSPIFMIVIPLYCVLNASFLLNVNFMLNSF